MKVLTQENVSDLLSFIVKKANLTMCLDNEDKVLAIYRFFHWNEDKILDKWYQDSEKLSLEIGITYDESIREKHPQVDDSTAQKNSNMCGICFCEFEDEDGWRADSLECGHQYNGECWSHFLKNQVKEQGPSCVFTKCPQSKCNMVVPHSFFLKFLKNEKDEEDQVNYFDKYMKWHCK